MATERNHNRMRSRWGMCLNDACEKSKNHERIEIVGRKDFVCPECGKPLKECPPPPPPAWPKYLAIAAGVLVLGGAGYWGFTQMGSESDVPASVDTTTVVQTPQEPKDTTDKKPQQQPTDEVQKPTVNPSIEKPVKGGIDNAPKAEGKKPVGGATSNAPVDRPYGTVRVAYGTYTGDLRNGKPHGHGKVKFSSTYKINSSIVAHSGDTYEGEFRDGRISGGQGYWSHDGDMTSVMP